MLKYLKKKFMKIKERLMCNHNYVVNRWHYNYGSTIEPIKIEVEYICDKCGKKHFSYILDRDEQRVFAEKYKYSNLF